MKEGQPSTPRITEYLSKTLPPNSFVGVDGSLYNHREYSSLEYELRLYGHELKSIPTNLVDLIWTDRPTPTSNIVFPLTLNYTGKQIILFKIFNNRPLST